MPDNKLEIKLQVKNQKANKALKDTENAVKGVEEKAKGTEKQLGRMRIATSGLRRTMGALRNNLLLVSFAFGGTVAALGKTVKAYGEQQLAEKKLESALGKTNQALLDQASALQSVTTFGDENIIQAQALIAAFTDDEEAIKRATAATLDLAAAKGMDLFAAADLVAKTLGSSTNAMSRYGIEVTGAVGSTERLDTLTNNIAKTFGGQAKAQAETMSGALKQASNAAGDAADNLGELLEPVIIKSAKLFKGAAEAVGTYFDELRTLDEMELQTTEDVGRLNHEFEKQQNALGRMRRAAESDPKAKSWYTQFFGNPEDIKAAEERLKVISQRIEDILGVPNQLGDTPLIPSDFYLDVDKALVDFTATQYEALANYEQEQDLLTQFIELHGEAAKALGLETDETKKLRKEKEEQIKLDEKAAKLKEEQMQMGLQGANKIGASMVAMAKTNKTQTIAALHFSQAAAMASAIEGSMKAFGKGGIGGFIMGTALLAEGLSRVQQINQQIAEIKSIKAAQFGADFVTSGPQMMMVGDNPSGMERVQVTPLGGDPNIEGPQGSSITVNVSGNVMTEEFTESQILPALKEALRRGGNLDHKHAGAFSDSVVWTS